MRFDDSVPLNAASDQLIILIGIFGAVRIRYHGSLFSVEPVTTREELLQDLNRAGIEKKEHPP